MRLEEKHVLNNICNYRYGVQHTKFIILLYVNLHIPSQETYVWTTEKLYDYFIFSNVHRFLILDERLNYSVDYSNTLLTLLFFENFPTQKTLNMALFFCLNLKHRWLRSTRDAWIFPRKIRATHTLPATFARKLAVSEETRRRWRAEQTFSRYNSLPRPVSSKPSKCELISKRN